MKFLRILVVLLLVLVGCTTKPETETTDFIEIVEKSNDYRDYKNDFKAYGKEFEPVLRESTKLTDEVIEQRIAESKNSTNPAMSVIYEGLPKDSDLYYIEFFDKTKTNRGIIAVIDVENRDVLRFYAIIDVRS